MCKLIKVILLLLIANIVLSTNAKAQKSTQQKWIISGKPEIKFDLSKSENLPYSDNIEMSGKRVSGIISYSVDTTGKLALEREIFFPQLHQFKSSEDSWYHDYRAYLQYTYGDDLLPKLYVNNQRFVPGKLSEIAINGVLNFKHAASKNGVALTRTLFPSVDERLFVELWTVTNTTSTIMEIVSGNTSLSYEDYGAKGKYSRLIITDAPDKFMLKPQEEKSFSIKIMAKMQGENYPSDDVKTAFNKRMDFLEEMKSSLQLETPNAVLNTLFDFSKIRAAESIFESELGLIHSPGGGRYYVGIWANDQAEYINPFFSYLGYDVGNQSAMSAFRAFKKEINPEYDKIRYSFEIEGLVKPFLLDRGDAAMIAYGAAHYAMALGDKETANELWPLIEWCLEYCNRQLNEEGVVLSESDEMEGRIETGNANLSTSSLYYGALNHTIDLAISLKKPKIKYEKQASDLKKAIESYFGANIEGIETYKYYKEHKHLRHWICLPLVVDIKNRKSGTIEALFDRLWTDNGVHVEKNSDDPSISKIFWDRGTLYALRGTFFAGETEKSLEKLIQFSKMRLVGERVPYVVEAYPEGGMAHLSAESALYCRIFTEGLFGIVPTSLKSFKLTPRLPKDWGQMALRNIKAFDEDFTIQIVRECAQLRIKVIKDDKTVIADSVFTEGETLNIEL